MEPDIFDSTIVSLFSSLKIAYLGRIKNNDSTIFFYRLFYVSHNLASHCEVNEFVSERTCLKGLQFSWLAGIMCYLLPRLLLLDIQALLIIYYEYCADCIIEVNGIIDVLLSIPLICSVVRQSFI